MYHISFTDGSTDHTLHTDRENLHIACNLLEDSRYTRFVIYDDHGINLGRSKVHSGLHGYTKLLEELYPKIEE